MGLSLNIINHALEEHGVVHFHGDGNMNFEDTRLYSASTKFLDRHELLYVCSTSDLPKDAGFFQESCLVVVPPEENIPRGCCVAVKTELPALEICSLLQDLFLEFRLWESSLDHSVAEKEGVQALIDLARGCVPNHLVVVDSSMHLLGYSKNTQVDDPVVNDLIKHGYHTLEMIREYKLMKYMSRWRSSEGFNINNNTEEGKKYDRVVYSFNTKDSFSLMIIMTCNEVNPKPDVIDRLSKLIDRIGIYARNEYTEITPSGITINERFRNLVGGVMKDETTIKAFAEAAHIPYTARFCLFVIRADEGTMPASSLVSYIGKLAAPAKTFYADPYVVVLCFNCSRSQCARVCTGGEECQKGVPLTVRLNEALESIGSLAGRSAAFSCLSELPVSFRQATSALRVGKLIDTPPAEMGHPECNFSLVRPIAGIDSNIKPYEMLIRACFFDKESLGDFDLITNTVGIRILNKIAADDEVMNTDNYKFLYYYIIYERRVSVVADKQYMHRNNVRYRIDRIEKTYKINTEDPDTRFALLEAFHLRNIMCRLGVIPGSMKK